jgi:hypothetical protein
MSSLTRTLRTSPWSFAIDDFTTPPPTPPPTPTVLTKSQDVRHRLNEIDFTYLERSLLATYHEEQEDSEEQQAESPPIAIPKPKPNASSAPIWINYRTSLADASPDLIMFHRRRTDSA